MFQQSEKSVELQAQLTTFFDQHIYPNEVEQHKQLSAASRRFAPLSLVEELKSKAKAAGLWNLFIPPAHAEFSSTGGLSNVEYAPLAELMGRVLWSAEVFNCNAPDTGNMEVLMKYATSEQQNSWLTPLLEGEIRSS